MKTNFIGFQFLLTYYNKIFSGYLCKQTRETFVVKRVVFTTKICPESKNTSKPQQKPYI